MIPRIDLLIRDARIASLETDYGESHGINQEFFRVALNKANLTAQIYFITENCECFTRYKTYTIESETESVDPPSDIFMPNLIYEVRYGRDTNEACLDLPMRPTNKRGDMRGGIPEEFFPDAGKIYLDRMPSTGILRVRYEARIETLDFRRGTVDSVTGTAPDVSTIILEDDDWLDTTAWETLPEIICAVDYAGVSKMKNILVESYDSNTRTITVRSVFEGEEGEEIEAGDYICFGTNATTHSSFQHFMELLYIQFIQDEVNDLLSSDGEETSRSKMNQSLSKITEMYANLPGGFISIPNINDRGY